MVGDGWGDDGVRVEGYDATCLTMEQSRCKALESGAVATGVGPHTTQTLSYFLSFTALVNFVLALSNTSIASF